MARVVLQPAGSAASQKHYEDTVRNAVPLAQCAGLPLQEPHVCWTTKEATAQWILSEIRMLAAD
jgi:hypothetical protein